MFVLCVVSKGKMQDNQDKEPSTDEVQSTRELRKSRRGHVCLSLVYLSGRCLCDGPIPRPEKSYRLSCVSVCDLETSAVKRSGHRWAVAPRKKKPECV
jgi:hypothetical protein